MKQYGHFINGETVAPGSGEWLDVIDPSTGEPWAQIAAGNAADINRAVTAARASFDQGPWGQSSAAERSRLLLELSRVVAGEVERLAAIESRDTGKPIRQARADAQALARYFEYYGGAADKLHGQTLPYQTGYSVMTVREAHGVTGHIVPWNYPMQIFGRSVGAALAVGNACVVKPAEDACLSLLEVARLASRCGLPAGALNIVCGTGVAAGAPLAAHADIDHISFTGSGPTGRLVAEAAAARHSPVTLELGGKSAQLVFGDADLDAALPVLVNAITQNCGQTCSAGSRVLVERPVYEAVIERLGKAFGELVSAPGNEDRDLGPLINARQLARVRQFVADARRDGIRVVATGRIAEQAPRGGYYQPAVLFADVPPDHALAQQEVFGPVLAVMPFDTEEQAVALANGTPYGLIAGVWTRDGARQLRVARKLRCGQVFINNYGAGGGVELPFGGVKHSGYGREKGFEALYGFTTLKTIAIRHG